MNKQLLFVSIVLLETVVSQAQWQTDVRLTNNPALSSTTAYSNARCIASSGDTVHVVWRDNRDGGNYEIYYKRSIDGGLSWGSDTRISNNIYFSLNPSISVSGSLVHVVWEDNRDGNYEIYYNHSTDGGVSWGTDTRLTNDAAASQNPSVSVSGLVVHVVWDDNRDGSQVEVYYKQSADGGLTWGADTRLTNDPAGSWNPSISAIGSAVHVLWLDGRNGHQDIYYKRSTDEGLTWGADTPLTNDTVIKNNPAASISGSIIYVIWLDSRDRYPNYEIYYKRSTDGGISWGADTRVTTNYTSAFLLAAIFVSGSGVHVVWADNRDGNYEIYYKGSTDGGLSWGADTRLTNNTAISAYPFVSSSGSVVHVVWMDNRDGNFEIYYKRDVTGPPATATVTGTVTSTACYNATQTITVAGNLTTFIVQVGGNATFIAGQKISFLPGTTVQAGGYMWGYIAPDGPYCNNPSMPSFAMSEDEIPWSIEQSSFRIYPNPTMGNFILELSGETSVDNVTVDIIGKRGEKMSTALLNGERKHEFSLSDKPLGVYFIRVISGNKAETVKIIKQ